MLYLFGVEAPVISPETGQLIQTLTIALTVLGVAVKGLVGARAKRKAREKEEESPKVVSWHPSEKEFVEVLREVVEKALSDNMPCWRKEASCAVKMKDALEEITTLTRGTHTCLQFMKLSRVGVSGEEGKKT